MIWQPKVSTFKQENVLAERLHGLDQQMERKGDESLYFMDRIWVLLVGSVMDEAHASRYLVHPGADKTYYNLGDMLHCQRLLDLRNCSEIPSASENEIESPWTYLLYFQDAAESVRDAIGFEYCLAILQSEATDKGGVGKGKAKAARDCQKSYVDYRHKLLEFEVGDRVLLKVTPWKGIVCFGKKGKLAPRYVGPFEILERIGLVAYRLRLPEELNSVHDTFHVLNLKKYLADAYLHVPLDEINVDKTLRFVKELVEIMHREIKKLKRKKIEPVKVGRNLKRGPAFTWEHKDQMRIKYQWGSVERVVETAANIGDEISSKRGYCDIRDLISAFVFGDEYSICSRIVIMERNGVLHAMLRQ
ncbi:hypothetical protein Tco_0143983 [Tanacetum coccineum]